MTNESRPGSRTTMQPKIDYRPVTNRTAHQAIADFESMLFMIERRGDEAALEELREKITDMRTDLVHKYSD